MKANSILKGQERAGDLVMDSLEDAGNQQPGQTSSQFSPPDDGSSGWTPAGLATIIFLFSALFCKRLRQGFPGTPF